MANKKSLTQRLADYLKKIRLPGFASIVSFLGSYAGSHDTSKGWRRYAIPLISMGYAYFRLRNYWVITILPMMGALSMGYGVPSKNDEGSDIGKFWYKIFKGNHRMTDYFTRGTIGLMIALSLLSVPLIKHNWLIYLLSSLAIVLSQSFISWRGWGSVEQKIFGKEVSLLRSDLANYGIIGLAIYILITF